MAIIPSFDFEQSLISSGFDWVIGLDEVGRGSLAGPVMVGAALFSAQKIKSGSFPQGLADSKLLNAHKREGLLEPIENWCDAFAVGSCTNRQIDEWGISYALGVAAINAINDVQNRMRSSLKDAQIAAILDGPFNYVGKALGTFDAPSMQFSVKVHTLVKADQKCASVSAASVIAKVTRDSLMIDLAQNPKYAVYDWAHNKGYGSKAHRDAILEHGASDLHRLSWHLG